MNTRRAFLCSAVQAGLAATMLAASRLSADDTPDNKKCKTRSSTRICTCGLTTRGVFRSLTLTLPIISRPMLTARSKHYSPIWTRMA